MVRCNGKVVLNGEIVPNNIKNLILDIDNCALDSREWEKYIPADNSRAGWDNYHDHYYIVSENCDMATFVYELCRKGLERM